MIRTLKSIFRNQQPTAPPTDDKIKTTRKAPPKFRNEAEMKMHYAHHLDEIEPGLRLYADENTDGIEVPCRVTTWGRQGAIDILAIDEHGRLVVIECKHKYADAMSFGQVLGYLCYLLHWLRSVSGGTLPLPGAIVRDGFKLGPLTPQLQVRAYIVAKRANPLLKLLLDSFPSFPVTVFEYERALDIA